MPFKHSDHWYVVRMTAGEAVDTLHSGNRTDFATWVKKATKHQILDAIDYYALWYGEHALIINDIRKYL